MPPAPIVIGEEFEWSSVSNGDGGTLALFVTVVDSDGHFTVRAEQSGPSGGSLVIRRANGTVLRTFNINPGSRALVALEDSVAINVPFQVARTRCELAGGFRTFGRL
jgi:hypothetical protein